MRPTKAMIRKGSLTIIASLVEPYPAPCLHSSSLDCSQLLCTIHTAPRACAARMRQERRRGTRLPYEYYEEVRIMPDECLSQPGTAMGVGPGLCGVRRMEVLRTS